jgi:hypothetical protein
MTLHEHTITTATPVLTYAMVREPPPTIGNCVLSPGNLLPGTCHFVASSGKYYEMKSL